MNKFVIVLSKEYLDIVIKGIAELPLKEALPVFNEINNQYIKQVENIQQTFEDKQE